MLKISILLILLTYAETHDNRYRVLELKPTTSNESLQSLNKAVRFLVSQNDQVMIEEELKRLGFVDSIARLLLDYNAGQLENNTNYDFEGNIVDITEKSKRSAEKLRSSPKIQTKSNSKVLFNNYLDHGQINDYLDKLAKQYPNIARVHEVGKSYENRSIKIITISNEAQNWSSVKSVKTIFIDAGIHAREWLAPATAIFIISELIENHMENQYFINNFKWVIMPLVNPDGYMYSRYYNHLWRKNRRPLGKPMCEKSSDEYQDDSDEIYRSEQCIGTDLNRNFGYYWEKAEDPCDCYSLVYPGPIPFSEPESIILRDTLLAFNGTCTFYLTIHSYGGYLVYPMGYDITTLPLHWRILHKMARAGAKAIKQFNNSTYKIGNTAKVLYPAAGGSDDYAMGLANVTMSMTMELPEVENTGFHPPKTHIYRLVQESWIIIKAMIREMKNNL